ncbi:MAG: hypothetical protein ABT15_31610 [Pseudonocardia sp. SCN 73-27]|uniref:acyl carrier protein n=1 Tax=Pseudonocardia sp. SCN 73-27 TaxID=1660132 RepID=UPI000868CBD4|nr:acyl carrier protein [Pseudonocardia sp. SCN 73-27]ODU99470.1 MAG: hypothetical protein ABT15_31610 [Pseudonocardia sp. SCN 73-27]
MQADDKPAREVVEARISSALPELTPEDIRSSSTLSELGLDSMERLDIVVGSADDLGVIVDPRDFTSSNTIGDIALQLARSPRRSGAT